MNIYPLISDEETESERLNDVLKITQQDLGLRLGTASAWLWYQVPMILLCGPFVMVTAPCRAYPLGKLSLDSHFSPSPGPGVSSPHTPFHPLRRMPDLVPPHHALAGDRCAVHMLVTQALLPQGLLHSLTAPARPAHSSCPWMSTLDSMSGSTPHHETLPGILVPTCPRGRRSPW